MQRLQHKEIHKADSRGSANISWLEAKHTFSFADYYDPKRIHFGVLRVLNDDIIAPSKGFGTHPHDNMEIISIPISGSLKHKDIMGNEAIIKQGEVQVMSAGSGITHSEFNASDTDPVNLLQIWIIPKEKNVEPRYDQKDFSGSQKANTFQLVISPDGRDESLMIHQNAFFSLSTLEAGKQITYTPYAEENGLYLFVINGEVGIDNDILSSRDGAAFTTYSELILNAKTASRVLIMEVPFGAALG